MLILYDSVVAYGGIVTKSVDKNGSIVVGNPGKVIKENINWKR